MRNVSLTTSQRKSMRSMNKNVLEEVNTRVPFVCERNLLLRDHQCEGRITREHALLYGGKKIDEYWAIVLLCEKSHNIGQWMDCGIMDKRINEWIAINRMTKEDEGRFPKVNWKQKRKHLNSIFGNKALTN